ncbi:uncharacterized protein LOC143280219 [Babylonia areolata]|uniref:uncharacterized protein LOC143280219 n=1 Tax=Babylonia areolata TaxID=304850 RepID=UPI003FD4D278
MVDYAVLKDALLTKFQYSKDGFREKFRLCQPENEESFPAFFTRLSHLFDRWVDLAHIEKSYEALHDLVLSEQFLLSVSKDLAVFLKERVLKDTKAMVTTAEHYRLAHPGKSFARSVKVDFGLAAGPFKGSIFQANEAHLVQDLGVIEEAGLPSAHPREEDKEIRCWIQDMNPNRKKTHQFVLNAMVSVLRDTGATTASVRRELVRPDQFVGRTQKAVSFGGIVEVFPLAKVEVESPFFSVLPDLCDMSKMCSKRSYSRYSSGEYAED